MKINSMGPLSTNDGLYCGDLCGMGCTLNEFKRVIDAAQDAANAMPGWEANVWENLGWHWNLVREVGDVRWHLSLNTKQRWECYSYGGGQQVWTCGFDTPKEAVARAKDALIGQIARATRDLNALTGTQL